MFSIKTLSFNRSAILRMFAPLVAFGVLSLMAMPASGGPTTSGGGANFCYLPTGPVLLDLVGRPKMPESSQVPLAQRVPGVKIQKTWSKFEPFDPYRGPFEGPSTGALERRVQAIIQPFMQRYPLLGSYLNFGVNNVQFVAIPQRFLGPVAAHLDNPSLCGYPNTRAVIALNGGIKFVSRPDWNELDLDTQADAIIHEGWRYVQVVLRVPITDKDLQDLTYFSIVDPEAAGKSELMARLNLFLHFGAELKLAQLCQDRDRYLAKPGMAALPEEATRALRLACTEPNEISRGLYARSTNAILQYAESLVGRQDVDLASEESTRTARSELLEYYSTMTMLMGFRGITMMPFSRQFDLEIMKSMKASYFEDLLADFPVGK